MEETALATADHRSLLERMATQYGLDAKIFQSVLLKTVFPQDKAVTMEQLAMFCGVAHNYGLNPLLREIYAFPAQNGGIVPVVGYDGWVTIIQRKKDYDGCEYEHIWEDGEVGKALIGCTCKIYRKDFTRPISKTVWFNEVRRDTAQWKQKPIWMTELKALIQAARLAYGFGGIYDPDEAENILEMQAQAKVVPRHEPVALPQAKVEVPETPELIGTGRARAIHIMLGKNKIHTQEELTERWLTPNSVEHISALPASMEDALIAWVEGNLA